MRNHTAQDRPVVWGVHVNLAPSDIQIWTGAQSSARDALLIRKYLEQLSDAEKKANEQLFEIIRTRQQSWRQDCAHVTLRNLQSLVIVVNKRFHSVQTSQRIHLALRSVQMALCFLNAFRDECMRCMDAGKFANGVWSCKGEKEKVGRGCHCQSKSMADSSNAASGSTPPPNHRKLIGWIPVFEVAPGQHSYLTEPVNWTFEIPQLIPRPNVEYQSSPFAH
jgi:hypothetical protein